MRDPEEGKPLLRSLLGSSLPVPAISWQPIVLVTVLSLLAGCATPDLTASWNREAALSPQAHYEAALRWLRGGPGQDYARANRHFAAAANQGHVRAQYFLGMAYYTGRGVRQSYPNARYWLEQAAGGGDRNAQYHLGDIYLNGWGVERDPEWAAMWFGRAAQQDHTGAQVSLGVCFAAGLGVPKRLARALAWWERAAAKGDETAARLLRRYSGAVSRRVPAPLIADGLNTPPVVLYVQRVLQRLGYRPGSQGGIWGVKTRAALARFLEDEKRVVPPEITPEVLTRLRRASGKLPSPWMDRLRRWFR
ncbi:MAG: hypothetical protein Kow006_12100 [Gammaproteobacteria bacterium]